MHFQKNAAQGKYTLAILQYGSSSSSEPTTTATVCSNQVQPCEVLNCPWPFFGEDERITCVGVDQMVREDGTPDTPLLEMNDTADDYFLNWHLILDRSKFSVPKVSVIGAAGYGVTGGRA